MGPSVPEGPLFVTCRVQSKVCPATAVPVWVLVIARSTTASTFVTSVSTLLARLGSFVGDDTRAVFVRGAREVEVGVDVDDDLHHGPVTRGQGSRTGRT